MRNFIEHFDGVRQEMNFLNVLNTYLIIVKLEKIRQKYLIVISEEQNLFFRADLN